MRLLISRGTRLALQLDEPSAVEGVAPAGSSAQPLATSFRSARALAEKLEPLLPPEMPRVSAGDLHALERLEEALRTYLGTYLAQRDADVLARALEELDRRFGPRVVDRLLGSLEDEFLDERSEPESRHVESPPHRRQELLGELLIFSIVHSNPAAGSLGHLLHFGGLVGDPEYDSVVFALEEFLEQAPGLEDDDPSLISALRRPIEAAPSSIFEQVRWLSENWGELSPQLEAGFVSALDLITEENTPRFPPGPGPSEVPSFEHLDPEEVHYGADRGWMSSLVLAAKNTQVWLHQLSLRHQKEITRLDQIPDAEFEALVAHGITGLWLIGLWQRSRASKRIKQLCGNPEAAGSAYSLVAYRIAPELGGEAALGALERQAAGFGIRLSADMVPNHTGIDSEWMIERPELFLSVPECPFPSYTFEGPDLSSDPRVAIYLEDHYFDRTDAAVVFKRLDRRTGEVLYVYHGNDGTGMPWNDTAQLDYLNPATREAVTETILEVARRFPIIRFDAAMTLAQRHIQRLWHPQPGSAGAIPSRAEHAMSESEFKARMPREFWRDVVDRAASEAPDTLLLAEAFWLMEGYFVRNLGLHRVYNSAFMNMLRDYDNSGYRELVRKALAFDPEILRRYVNFLSNPDEKTAVEQFGDGDRYFGACVLLATMPGLPMIAHGQIEGLRERYGMEYRRAYVDEEPDSLLIERHETEIAPLLRERERFAGIEGFAMHDFVDRSGRTDDNVLAFSHAAGAGSGDPGVSLVIFNNQPAPTRGVLRLAHELDVSAAADRISSFRDRLSQRKFLRIASAIHDRGLELELAGYESLVLVDFREFGASEDGGIYPRLFRHLGLRGTPSFAAAVRQIHIADARQAFGEVLGTLAVAQPLTAPARVAIEEKLDQLDRHLESAFEPIAAAEGRPGKGTATETADLATWLEAISRLAAIEQACDWPGTERMLAALDLIVGSEKQEEARILLPAFALMGYIQERWGVAALSSLEPGPTTLELSSRSSLSEERATRLASLIDIAALGGWLGTVPPPGRELARSFLEEATGSEIAARTSGYDRDNDSFQSPTLRQFLTWRATTAALAWLAAPAGARQDAADAVVGWCDVLETLASAIEAEDRRLAPVLQRL